jgi:hypothetical protein
VLRFLAWTLCVLLCPTLVFAAVDSVLVAPPRTQIVSSRTDLVKLCGSESWIYACTKFLGEKLSSTCVAGKSGWHTRTSAQFIPYMYLWQVSSLAHEKLHIDDIRASLAQYLHDLDARTYASEADCEQAAESETLTFSHHMDEWKKASNAKRHWARK